jgi:dGTPase
VLEPEKQSAEHVIRELFAHWMERPKTLPRSYQEKAKEEPLARVVCDYIAGMTDNYIMRQYRRVIGKEQKVAVSP